MSLNKFLENNIILIETFYGNYIPFNNIKCKKFLTHQGGLVNRVFGFKHGEMFIINFKDKHDISKNDTITFRKDYMVINSDSEQIIKFYGTPINNFIKPTKKEVCETMTESKTFTETLYSRLNNITDFGIDITAQKYVDKFLN